VSEPERLDLAHPRDVGPLLGDALALYVRNFPTVFAVSAAIVVPVQLIVSGLGLEELTASYRESPTTAEILVPTAVSFLVVVPLIAAATIHVLQTLAAGQRPRPIPALQAGLDLFTPVFVAVLLAGLAIALGLTLLILPGIYLAVRLFFVAQAVVIDGARSTDALRRSWSVSDGNWWRIFGVALLANLIAFLPGTLIVAPFESFAESADRQAISLAGMILTETLTAPFVALVSTLLYHDLCARRMRPE
jgi:hypothetical protein